MVVNSKPFPSAKFLFSSPKVFEYKDLNFYKLGRYALLDCCINLGLKTGDKILFPAYMCFTTISPLIDYGFEIKYIDFEKNLDISLSDLESLFLKNSINAFIWVNFFGVTEIAKGIYPLCKKYGVRLIIDNSHCSIGENLANENFLGDAEIYSFRKTIPTFDGGAYRIKKRDLNLNQKEDKNCFNLFNLSSYLLIRLFEKVLSILKINIYSDLISSIRSSRSKSSKKNNTFVIKKCAPSLLLKNYLSNKEYKKKSEKRIHQNFFKILRHSITKGYLPLTNNKPSFFYPQACPVIDESELLKSNLRKSGIGAWNWPDSELPEEIKNNPRKYPNANYLNKNLVLIPVHQDINDIQLSFIMKNI